MLQIFNENFNFAIDLTNAVINPQGIITETACLKLISLSCFWKRHIYLKNYAYSEFNQSVSSAAQKFVFGTFFKFIIIIAQKQPWQNPHNITTPLKSLKHTLYLELLYILKLGTNEN